MKYIIFLLFPIITFGQTECKSDTLINRMEYLRLIQLTKDCNDEISNYIRKINNLESVVTKQRNNILILEELLINREKFIIKKCPTFKRKKSKRRSKI
jgi:hypothetical protein